MEHVTEIGYGQEPGDLYRKYRFHLPGSQSARVLVLNKQLFRADVHFLRTYFYCLGENCPGCEESSPNPRYLQWVFVYNLDDDGKPIRPISGRIRAWMFGRDKYSILSQIAQQVGDLRKMDLQASCQEEKYQRMTIIPVGEPALYEDRNAAEKVAADLKRIMEEVPARRLMARELTPNQILNFSTSTEERQAPKAQDTQREPAREGAPPQSRRPTDAELKALLDDLEEDESPFK